MAAIMKCLVTCVHTCRITIIKKAVFLSFKRGKQLLQIHSLESYSSGEISPEYKKVN